MGRNRGLQPPSGERETQPRHCHCPRHIRARTSSPPADEFHPRFRSGSNTLVMPTRGQRRRNRGAAPARVVEAAAGAEPSAEPEPSGSVHFVESAAGAEASPSPPVHTRHHCSTSLAPRDAPTPPSSDAPQNERLKKENEELRQSREKLWNELRTPYLQNELSLIEVCASTATRHCLLRRGRPRSCPH